MPTYNPGLDPRPFSALSPEEQAIRSGQTQPLRQLQFQSGQPEAILAEGQKNSGEVGSQILDLLRSYQKFGRQQEQVGQQEQISRVFQTPQELIGASPQLQSNVRQASVEAVQPQIGAARSLVEEAKNLITEFQQTEEKNRTTAQNLVTAAISSGAAGLEELLRVNPEIFKKAGYDAKSFEAVLKGIKAGEAEKKRQFDVSHEGGGPLGDYRKELNKELDNIYGGVYGKQGAREKALAKLKAKYPDKDVASDIYTRVPDGYEANIVEKTTVKQGRLQELLEKSNGGQNLESLTPAELLELNSML